MTVRVREAVTILERLSPPHLALESDPIGLQVGDLDKIIKGIVVTLDVTKEAVTFTLSKKANLIIAHHPLIYQPLHQVTETRPVSQIVRRLVKSDVSVFIAHTNLDIAENGTNHILASGLGIEIESGLETGHNEKYYKLVIYVPRGHEQAIIEAIATGGGGVIGQYSHCTFRIKGTGTFFPLEGTRPYLGQAGQLESAEEYRLETVIPNSARDSVLMAVRAAHPYEEMAYDLYALENPVNDLSLGVIGHLHKAMSLNQLARHVARLTGSRTCRLVGDRNRQIKRVALCTGGGSDLIPLAIAAGADCYITSDIKFHQALKAQAADLGLIDVGHYETEAFYLPYWAEYIKKEIPELARRIFIAKGASPFKPVLNNS